MTGKEYPSAHRLKRRPQYLAVREQGRHIYTRHFIVQWMPGLQGYTRLGVTVTRRIGNAVVRNRVKRLVREAFRLAGGNLPAGTDLVVIAKKGSALLNRMEASTELERAWRTISAKQ